MAAGSRKIPSSVWVAIAMVVVMQLARCTMGLAVLLNNPQGFMAHVPQLVIAVGVGGFVIAGLVVGHRLAWQWGRILAMLAGLLLLLALVSAYMTPSTPLWIPALLLLQALPMVFVYFCLGTMSAHQHFRLVCPTCGALTRQAADFLFYRARCQCGIVW